MLLYELFTNSFGMDSAFNMEGESGPSSWYKNQALMFSLNTLTSISLHLLNEREPSIPEKYFDGVVKMQETSLIWKYVEILLG